MPDTSICARHLISKINWNLSASREEWELAYIPETQP